MKKFVLALSLLSLLASSLWANTLSEIHAKKVVRVGVYESEPPFSKKTESGFEGFEVELANKLANAILGASGGTIELIGMTNEMRFPALQENRADLVVAAVSVTEERRKLADFSMPYFSVNLGLLTKNDSSIKAVSDMSSHKIGAVTKTTGEAFLKQNGIGITYCQDSVDCYKKVKKGEIEGYINNNLFVMVYPILDSSVSVNLKNLGNTVFLAVAVQKGNTELLNFINEQLIALNKSGFFKKAYEETFMPFYKGTVDKKYFLLDDLYNFL